MDEIIFRYATACSIAGCEDRPRFKVAASWSYGPLTELKNYGLACESHREAVLDRARQNLESLAVGDDETVGPVEAHELAGSGQPADRAPK
ncbi:hypothetical protein P12x_004873 [Tundrisphaera lichenicola]|uniref:hypothetical protein n=1 Tax=Tundrisphaera lichenicola TaxID=2029860 RepID=UPI003EBD0599